jgi:hypothetical protein
LTDFGASLKLPSVSKDDLTAGRVFGDVSAYVHLTAAQLGALDEKQLREGAYIVSDFAFFVSRQANREEARVRYFYQELMRVVAPQLDNYRDKQFRNAEELKYCAIMGNDFAQELHRRIMGCEARAEELRGIADRLEKIAERLNRLSYKERT